MITRAVRFAFIGCFTSPERGARGRGIVTCRIGAADRRWALGGEPASLDNPSFLISDADRWRLYVAHGDRNYVSALAVDPEGGALRLLAQAASGGDNGVHLSLDPDGRFLVVANHDSGSLGLLPVTEDGALLDCVHRLKLPDGGGPHRFEQTGSHPHQVVFDPGGTFLLAPDKGLDRVFTLRLDGSRGRLELVGSAAFRSGSGPRHLAFHPGGRWAFVVCELDSTVVVCAWDARKGALEPRRWLPCLPAESFAANTAAAVVVEPDGGAVHVTNRGHDSIVHFTFDASCDGLTPAGWTASGGAVPRFMTWAPGGGLIVANEQGDSLVHFDRAGCAGRRLIQTPSPSAVAFL